MPKITRREFVKATTVAAAGVAIGSALPGHAEAADLSYKPEKGAKLRLLRWKRFVQGDEEQWMANTKKFTDKTGIEVRVDNEGWEDVRPKAAVAANVGSGPDIILGWFDDPHQYPDKLVDMTDLAGYIGGSPSRSASSAT
jgi:multiple sugar transport system substrate-binding protein